MKNQTNQRLQSILPAIIATIFLLGAFGSVFAQAKKKGAITEQEVKAYFIDWWTHDCDKSQACSVRFDSTVKIAPAVRHTFQIPPATYLTYPVKVDFTTHSNGGNFHLMHITRAVYYFYRNSFGDWEMGKEGERSVEEKDSHQEGGTAVPPQQANNAAKGGAAAQTSANKIGGTAAPAAKQVKAEYPKPDFSEMEDWFEIVRFEYPKAPDREMTIFFKPTVEQNKRPYIFYVEFRDKDGVLVQDPTYSPVCCSSQLGGTETGTNGKVTVNIPAEKDMEKVVSVKIIRAK